MKKILPFLIGVAVTATLFGGPLSASAQVPNSSFQNPAETGDTLTTSSTDATNLVQDFTISNPGGQAGIVVYNNTQTGAAPDNETGGTGSQGLELYPYYGYYQSSAISGNSTNNDGTAAGSTGIISTVLANTSYTLTADVGIPGGDAAPVGEGFQGYIELALIDANNNAVFASTRVNQTALSVGSLTTETLSFTSSDVSGFPFTSTATSDQNTPLNIALGDGLKIELLNANGSADSHIPIIFDNVTFSGPMAATPEPSTYVLLLSGLALFGLTVRRFGKLSFNS